MDLRKNIHERIDEIPGKIVEDKFEITEEKIFLNRKRTTITCKITYEDFLEVDEWT